MKRKIRRFPLWVIASLMFALSLPAISWTSANFHDVDSKKNAITVSADNSDDKSVQAIFEEYISGVYNAAGLDKASMDINVFRKAIVGYYNLKHNARLAMDKSIITIVDFNKPSTEKRLWIVDLQNKKLLFNTLVAHGQGSGDNVANAFSNTSNSNQSSLGFYVASETYSGKHGLSLRLDGMDDGFNTNARNRGVVVHGADYVSQSFINSHGRLGRSWGCPALPAELTSSIIDMIKGKTCLYIDGPSANYTSQYLDENVAMEDFSG